MAPSRKPDAALLTMVIALHKLLAEEAITRAEAVEMLVDDKVGLTHVEAFAFLDRDLADVERELSALSEPRVPLMPYLYTLRELMDQGVLTIEEAATRLVEGRYVETYDKALDYAGRDPVEIELELREQLDASRALLAQLEAEQFTKDWNAGKGFDELER